jgi:hypothetical protein
LKYNIDIRLQGQRKTMEHFIMDNWSPTWGMNPGSAEYEAELLPTRSQRSATSVASISSQNKK